MIVNGEGGTNTLSLNDQGNGAAQNYTLTATTVDRTGMATISYSNVQSLTLNGGSGGNTVSVLSTASTVMTTVNAGADNDAVSVGDAVNTLNGIQGPLAVDGQGGANTLSFNDQGNGAAQNYTLTATTVDRSGMATISYSNVQSLTLNGSGIGGSGFLITGTMNSFPTTLNSNGAGDAVNVQGSSATGALTITTVGGGATVNLSNAGHTVDGIANVTVSDPTATSTVTVNDSAFLGDETYGITNTSVSVLRLGTPLLAYNNIGALVVNGGTSTAVIDIFDIESTSVSTTVNGGPGPNCFHVSPVAQWLGANIVGPMTVNGNGADTLEFFDTNNPADETYTFDNVPSLLTLLTAPGFSFNWVGIGAGSVYLQTNIPFGHPLSMVNDPSGTVVVDGVPPCGPGPRSPLPGIATHLSGRAVEAALLDTGHKWDARPPVTHDRGAPGTGRVHSVQEQDARPPVAPLEAIVAALANHVAKKSSQRQPSAAEASMADAFQREALGLALAQT